MSPPRHLLSPATRPRGRVSGVDGCRRDVTRSLQDAPGPIHTPGVAKPEVRGPVHPCVEDEGYDGRAGVSAVPEGLPFPRGVPFRNGEGSTRRVETRSVRRRG